MFWDKIACIYDAFETAYNGKTNKLLCAKVHNLIGEDDSVLECACGTGMISEAIGTKCYNLIATDFSVNMLKQAKRKCSYLDNVSFYKADITNLKTRDDRFDIVVAGNVIHLLDDPKKALDELVRVCKPGGKVIVPTYVTGSMNSFNTSLINIFGKLGANFKETFTYDSYKQFINELGYDNVTFDIANGHMPCAIAIITKD